MTATNHGLCGAAIAISLHRYPILAVALAPISHFLLDAIPHYGDDELAPSDSRFLGILSTDLILAVITTLIVAFFWSQIAILVIVCAFLAASPDLMWLWLVYLKPTDANNWPWFAKFHSYIQWSQTKAGFSVELIWFAILFPALIFVSLS